MHRVPWLIVCSLALMLVCRGPAYGWNSRGHMMVAAVAYQKLTPQAKARVDALLLLNPDRVHWFDLIPDGTSVARTNMMLFMIAATWPDRIKSDPDYHSDGSHGGNRPPNDPSASHNIGYDDFARHKKERRQREQAEAAQASGVPIPPPDPVPFVPPPIPPTVPADEPDPEPIPPPPVQQAVPTRPKLTLKKTVALPTAVRADVRSITVAAPLGKEDLRR